MYTCTCIYIYMNSYYCVKENLCEVMFSVIRTPKLFPKREHYIRRYYTPPSPPLSFPRLFNSELLGCLSHSIRGAPTANVPKSKRKYLLTRKHDWQIRYRYRIITIVCHCVRQTWTETVCTLVYLVVGAVVQNHLNWKPERFTYKYRRGVVIVVIVSFKYIKTQ